LGPGFTFTTEFLGEPPQKGYIPALIVRGGGAPDFTVEQAWLAARALARRGVSTIGSLYTDGSLFLEGPDRHGDRAYEAGTGALAFNHNSLGVEVCPARAGAAAYLSIEPLELHESIEGTVTTVKGTSDSIEVSEGRDSHSLMVKGQIGERASCKMIYRSVPSPEVYFATTFLKILSSVSIKGPKTPSIGIVPSRIVSDKSFPKALLPLYSHHSKPLAEVVGDMNRYSNNFIADQLVHAIGKTKEGFHYEEGLSRIRALIAERFGSDVLFQNRDGSGLSHENRLTVDLLARVIPEALSSSTYGIEFENSLATRFRPGTLASRVYGVPEGAVRAKTGSLTGVVALAGTLLPRSGSKLLFVLIQNDVRSRDDALTRERKFIESVYESQ